VPTYQYACTECGEQLEAVQKFTDDPLTVCPVCQGKLRKLFSAVGIVFKGSGFYRTDSRNGSAAASAAKAESGAAASSGESASKSDSGSGSESKPAAKSETASSPAPASGTKPASGAKVA
jgi:putative FmdB family regulatory protein